MTIGEIIGLIIMGAIFGVLARLALPGRQSISALVTVILGILGAFIGFWIGDAMGAGTILNWILGIVVSAGLIVVYGLATGRRQV